MVNKTDAAHQYLANALKNLPKDNALSEVRHHMLQAIRKLEHVSKKRSRKESQAPTANQNWQFALNQGIVNPASDPKTALLQLDQMIEAEKAKIEAERAKQRDVPDEPDSGLLMG